MASMASDQTLHMLEQTIDDWMMAEYWGKLCPCLSVTRDTQAERDASSTAHSAGADVEMDAAVMAAMRQCLDTDGFLCLSAEVLAPLLQRDDLVARLAVGVARLVGLGHSPSSICVYDEHWELIRRLSPLLEAVTGNTASGDIFTFHKSADRKHTGANTHGFGSNPHRDKPTAGPESFRADGAAKYCTVWIALTDATPASSCLYVIPKTLDPGYYLEGDALVAALPGTSSTPTRVVDDAATTPHAAAAVDLGARRFENIQAVPVDAGGGCVFSHRLVHWGSRPSTGALPRVAMSYALADNLGEFEIGEFFSHAAYSPFPPLELRVALRAAQAVLYCEQKPFEKGGLGLATRIWRRGSRFFEPRFRTKVNDAAQWEKFMQGRR